MHILVTGGTGYIGAHLCVELIEAGHEPSIVDNLANSDAAVLERIAEITGYTPQLHQLDLLQGAELSALFHEHRFDAVAHLAGLKAVSESMQDPLRYYHVNVLGALNLFQAMQQAQVFRLVFSSSATVYGAPRQMPIRENCPTEPVNPYGESKLMVEKILRSLAATEQPWRIALLRYFNPIGAHPSGLIGEEPRDPPNNLMPYLSGVAAGRFPHLSVFGDDYPTPDGTGVRDYVHVIDLGQGHLKALEKLQSMPPGLLCCNLGTGCGFSVLEIIAAFEQATGAKIPYRVEPRRPGDIAQCYAETLEAQRILGWQSEKSLEDMCRDAWNWRQKNPDGYRASQD